jgi:hypothetical protein
MRPKAIFYFIILMASCQKEEIKVPDLGRKIVINSLLSTDSLLNANVSKSLYIMDTSYYENNLLNNAEVLIFTNNILTDTLHQNPIITSNYGSVSIYIPSNFISDRIYPSAGQEYKIVVKSPGLPDAVATTTIPDKPVILSIDTAIVRLQGSFDTLWQSNVRLYAGIEFKDPGETKNFYMLNVHRRPSQFIETNLLGFKCEDPVVEEYTDHGTITEGIAFSDKNINGKKYRLNIVLNGKDIGKPFYNDEGFFSETHKKVIYFTLYSITEDYFKYIQTLNLFLKNISDPLAEPTQVHSNVTGGYGILGGAAVACDSLVFTY